MYQEPSPHLPLGTFIPYASQCIRISVKCHCLELCGLQCYLGVQHSFPNLRKSWTWIKSLVFTQNFRLIIHQPNNYCNCVYALCLSCFIPMKSPILVSESFPCRKKKYISISQRHSTTVSLETRKFLSLQVDTSKLSDGCRLGCPG